MQVRSLQPDLQLGHQTQLVPDLLQRCQDLGERGDDQLFIFRRRFFADRVNLSMQANYTMLNLESTHCSENSFRFSSVQNGLSPLRDAISGDGNWSWPAQMIKVTRRTLRVRPDGGAGGAADSNADAWGAKDTAVPLGHAGLPGLPGLLHHY